MIEFKVKVDSIEATYKLRQNPSRKERENIIKILENRRAFKFTIGWCNRRLTVIKKLLYEIKIYTTSIENWFVWIKKDWNNSV